MKKIILILFLFLSCYVIYNITDGKEKEIFVLGDETIRNVYLEDKCKTHNNYYTNPDYRTIDLINLIKDNKEISISNEEISIHRLLNNTDILVLSIGMNDLYYKLSKDNKNIYTYLNDMIKNMNLLLKEINHYKYQKVLVLGYYSINPKHNDIITYINYKLSKLVKEYNYEYIELNNILKNNLNFYENPNNFTLNSLGSSEISKIIVEKTQKC